MAGISTVGAVLLACLCMSGAAAADNTLHVHLEAFGVWAHASGETTVVEHQVSAVSGPGVTMGTTTGCNPSAGGDELSQCEGSFTIADVSSIDDIQIVWSAGADSAYFFTGDADRIEFQFQAVDSVCDSNLNGPDPEVISGCGGGDGLFTFSGCNIFIRADLGSVPDRTQMEMVGVNATFPPLNASWSGREVTFMWGNYRNVRIRPSNNFSVSLVSETESATCSMLTCGSASSVSVAGELCSLPVTNADGNDIVDDGAVSPSRAAHMAGIGLLAGLHWVAFLLS